MNNELSRPSNGLSEYKSDSIYDLLSLCNDSHPYDIENAGKRALNALTDASIKEWLYRNDISCSDTERQALLMNMKEYISICSNMLLDPGLKDCYDAWLSSLVNVQEQSVAKARLSYMNSRKCQVRFGSKCFEMLNRAGSMRMVQEPSKEVKETGPKCRWCREVFDMKSFTTLQCKCTARIGHEGCAEKFVTDYKNKCPVCRSNLLKRNEISKYMFWGVNKKFSF